MTARHVWMVVTSAPLAAVFALSVFTISAHALTPDKPTPAVIVYIAALGSLGALLVVLSINRRQVLRRIKERSL